MTEFFAELQTFRKGTVENTGNQTKHCRTLQKPRNLNNLRMPTLAKIGTKPLLKDQPRASKISQGSSAKESWCGGGARSQHVPWLVVQLAGDGKFYEGDHPFWAQPGQTVSNCSILLSKPVLSITRIHEHSHV